MRLIGAGYDGFVVVIDPGHGGSNIGAVTSGGLLEKDLTLDVGLRLQDLLSSRTDVRVVMTRSEDRAVGLWDRRNLSRRKRADLFISIHFNGSPNRRVNRTEVFYSNNQSRTSARLFCDTIESAVGLQDGLVENVHWTVLWKNKAPLGAMLVEVLYLSHPSADGFLSSTENRDVVAASLGRAAFAVLDAETERHAARRNRGILASLGGMFR